MPDARKWPFIHVNKRLFLVWRILVLLRSFQELSPFQNGKNHERQKTNQPGNQSQ